MIENGFVRIPETAPWLNEYLQPLRARRCEQKKRWFRNGQKWRTGCEGRISVVKQRHGLGRSRYKGMSE
jgi:hypothetical protein